ncbi:MAG: hypothetical protein ACYC1D_14370 [Acidimicrobiales bacterium]
MSIVWPCKLNVDAYVAAGREVTVPRPDCPGCGVAMGRWGGYERKLRVGVDRVVWFRRVRCEPCAVSHAMIPAFCLVGRLDGVEVIGPALAAGVSGSPDREVAERIDLPVTTVRGWRRRHRDRAPLLVAGVVAVVVGLGAVAPRLSGDPERASVEVVGALWAAAKARLGERAGPAWRCWAVVTGGTALAPNTNPPWTGGGIGALLVPVPGSLLGGKEMRP